MKGSNRHVQSIGNVLPMKDSARDITFGEDGRFFREVDLFHARDQLKISGAVRFGDPVKLAGYQRRNHGPIFRQLMLPPTNRKIAAERLAVIKISTDY